MENTKDPNGIPRDKNYNIYDEKYTGWNWQRKGSAEEKRVNFQIQQ